MGTNAVGRIMTVFVLLLLFVNGVMLRKSGVLRLAGDRATGVVATSLVRCGAEAP
ncbi:MAG: hypothetical protein ACYC3L_03215 [Gemmatimonadaceae bacterium]